MMASPTRAAPAPRHHERLLHGRSGHRESRPLPRRHVDLRRRRPGLRPMNQVLPAASDDCTNALDEDCTGNHCTEAVWSKVHGATAGVTWSPTPWGNTYITGFFSGSFPIKNPPLTSSGGFERLRRQARPRRRHRGFQFGDVSNQFGRGIALDFMGNVIVTGYFPTASPSAPSPSGAEQRHRPGLPGQAGQRRQHPLAQAVRRFPPNGSVANQQGYAVTVDPSGRSIFAGQLNNKLDLGNGNPILVKGNTDAFIAKIDKTGTNILYGKGYGAAGSTPTATRVAVVGAAPPSSAASPAR